MKTRATFVLDASVTLAWVLEDETNEYTEAVLDQMETHEAVVPCIWPLEVSNAFLMAERRKRLSRAILMAFLEHLSSLPIVVEPCDPERVFGPVLLLAREQRLSVYDASYLDLALRLGLPLATQDGALRAAAARVGVEIFYGGSEI